jgi:hypothetical protein
MFQHPAQILLAVDRYIVSAPMLNIASRQRAIEQKEWRAGDFQLFKNVDRGHSSIGSMASLASSIQTSN